MSAKIEITFGHAFPQKIMCPCGSKRNQSVANRIEAINLNGRGEIIQMLQELCALRIAVGEKRRRVVCRDAQFHVEILFVPADLQPVVIICVPHLIKQKIFRFHGVGTHVSFRIISLFEDDPALHTPILTRRRGFVNCFLIKK